MIWKSLSTFFEACSKSEASLLKQLIRFPHNPSSRESHLKAGILFDVSETECINWAKIAPKTRSPFLCDFYPIIDTKESGEILWHPALIKLTNEFGEIEEFHDVLESRLQLDGAKTARLEEYLTLFKLWSKHPTMFYWVKDMIISIERQIDKEQKRNSENP